MSKYDKQCIIQFDLDAVAGANRVNLETKAANNSHPSVTVRVATVDYGDQQYRPIQNAKQLTAALKDMTNASRIYILGHGDWRAQTVAGISGPTLAKILFDHGLRDAKVISVVACSAGRDKGTLAGRSRLASTANSFASKFHYTLSVQYDLYIDVVARTLPVSALNPGLFASEEGMRANTGRKVTKRADGQLIHKAEGSKIRFTMNGATQVREIVQYQSTALYPTDEEVEEMMW